MSYESRFSPMQQQIIDVAMQIDAEEGYGYEPWNWTDDEFAAIEALAMNDEAAQRSAAEWSAMIEAAYTAASNGGDANLPGRLEIAQRLLEQ